MLALAGFGNGIGVVAGRVKAFAGDEARERGDVVREKLGGGNLAAEARG